MGGGREGNEESPLGAGTLLILMSSMSLLFRGVKKEDKSLAIGIQFMLLRVLGKELAWDHRPIYPQCAGAGGHKDE